MSAHRFDPIASVPTCGPLTSRKPVLAISHQQQDSDVSIGEQAIVECNQRGGYHISIGRSLDTQGSARQRHGLECHRYSVSVMIAKVGRISERTRFNEISSQVKYPRTQFNYYLAGATVVHCAEAIFHLPELRTNTTVVASLSFSLAVLLVRMPVRTAVSPNR